MIAALIIVSVLLTVSLCANAYLYGERRGLRLFVRKSAWDVRRERRASERWQDKTLEAKHMRPVNFPPPERERLQNVPMIARTPEEAIQRSRLQREGRAVEVPNGNGVLSERQRLEALKAAEDFTKGKAS